MKLILITFLSIFLVGCASTSQIVRNTHEKILHADSARIYVLRPSIFGIANSMKVYADDKYIGKTGIKSYLCWDVNGGEHTLRSSSENTDWFTIKAKAGKTYYIRQKTKPGIVSYRLSLEHLDEKDGRAILSKMKRPDVKYIE